jgi:hypothetical protein
MIYIGEDNHKSYEAELEDVRAWTIDMLKRLTSPVATKSIERISFLETNPDRARIETPIAYK